MSTAESRHVRVVWDDPGCVRFVATDEPVGGDVYATFAKAKASALARRAAMTGGSTRSLCCRAARPGVGTSVSTAVKPGSVTRTSARNLNPIPTTRGRGPVPDETAAPTVTEWAVQIMRDGEWCQWSAHFHDYEQAYRYFCAEDDRQPGCWRLVRRQVTEWVDVHA